MNRSYDNAKKIWRPWLHLLLPLLSLLVSSNWRGVRAGIETDTASPLSEAQSHTVALPLVMTSEGPTVIFTNGQVVTVEADMPTAQALAVDDDKILAVGSNEEMLALAVPNTRVIDLDGRALLPGFVDAHTHIFNDAELYLDLTLEEAQQLAFENGITSLADMYVNPDFLAQMQSFDQAGKLRLRTSLYLIYNTNCGDVVGDWYKQYPPTREPGEMLRIGGVKIFADGGSCGGPAVSVEFSPGSGLGELWLTQAQMNDAIAKAAAANYQVVVHAIGDRAVEQVQNAFETVLDGQANTLRHRIDHNAVIRPDLLPRYSEIGVVTVIFGHHTVCDMEPRNATYQEWEWPWRKLLDANPGLPVAWHGDDPWVGPISPILELYNLVTRQEVAEDGTVCQPPDWLAETAITAEEALPMMNIGSAYAIFRDEEVGSLKPGKFADLVVLSQNPLAVDANAIKDIEVWSTIVGGQTEYCASGHEAFCP